MKFIVLNLTQISFRFARPFWMENIDVKDLFKQEYPELLEELSANENYKYLEENASLFSPNNNKLKP